MMEDTSTDVNSIDFIRPNASHSGPEYFKDNQDFYDLLRNEGCNTISNHQRGRNGQAA